MSKTKLFDLEAIIKVETAKAYLLFDGTREGWVPKQLVENNKDDTFTMPFWLALDKGFV